MKIKNRIIFFAGLALLSTALLTGCGKSAAEGQTSGSEAATRDIQIVDLANRNITLPALPEKIITLGSSARMYTYIAGTDKIVGVEKKHQDIGSARPYILAYPELADIAMVGEGFPTAADPELILALEPDVILAGDLDMTEVQDLEQKTGIPVIVLSTGDDVIFDKSLYQSLEIIGQITGKTHRAEEVIAYMEDMKSDLEDRTKDIANTDKPSVYVGGLSYKGNHGIESTAGRSAMLDIIHANNIADEIGSSGSIIIDKEKLVDWDPDILIIDENGLSLVMEDYAKNPNYYKSLSAVARGQVYGQLPYISNYNNIETAMADVYYVGQILYPEAFKDIDPAEKADEIYQFMLNQPLYSKMQEKFGGYIKITLE